MEKLLALLAIAVIAAGFCCYRVWGDGKDSSAPVPVEKPTGYRSASLLLESLQKADIVPEERIRVTYELARHRGDPRVGPALLEQYMVALNNGDEGALSVFASALGDVYYGPAEQVLLEHLRVLLEDKWWVDFVSVQSIAEHFHALGVMHCQEAIPLYNEVLAAVLTGDIGKNLSEMCIAVPMRGDLLLDSDNPFDPYSMGHWFARLFYAPGCWDKTTVTILAQCLEVDGLWGCLSRAKSGKDGTPQSLGYLVSNALQFTLPWTHDWKSADYLRLANESGTLGQAYAEKVKELGPLKDGVANNTFIIGVVVDPAAVLAAGRRWLDPGVVRELPLSQKACFVLYLNAMARSDSSEPLSRLLTLAQSEPEVSQMALTYLELLVGNSFGTNWDIWKWWLQRAETELDWNSDTLCFGPPDKWEALQQEAMRRLDEKDDGTQ